MNSFFNQIYDYNFQSNKSLIDAFVALNAVPEKSLLLFSHVLNAHHIWNARIQERASEFEVWQPQSMEDFRDIHYENQRNSFEIISNTDDFEKRIDYENTAGNSFKNTLQDVLFHIINHSAYHRGQIAIDFRANGLEPLKSDYIRYKR